MIAKTTSELETSLVGIRAARERLAVIVGTIRASDVPPKPDMPVVAKAVTGEEAPAFPPANQLNQMIAQLASEVASQIEATSARVRAMQQAVLNPAPGTVHDVIDVEPQNIPDNSSP